MTTQVSADHSIFSRESRHPVIPVRCGPTEAMLNQDSFPWLPRVGEVVGDVMCALSICVFDKSVAVCVPDQGHLRGSIIYQVPPANAQE